MSKLDIKSALSSTYLGLGTTRHKMEQPRPALLRYSAPPWIRSAPYLSDQVSCTIEWVIINKLGIRNAIHILDDFFFVTSFPRSDCHTALCKILYFPQNSISLLPLERFFLPPPP